MSRRTVFLVCLVPAAYFLASGGYALANQTDYAGNLALLLRYAVGPLCIALALLAAGALLPRRVALSVGVNALAVLAGLFLVEAVLTASVVTAITGTVAAGTVDAATKSEVRASLPPAMTLKTVDKGAGVTRLSDALLGGVPDADVLLCRNADGPMIYRADRWGFNNPDAVHDAPARVLLIGDSFVEGVCLPRDEGLAGRLRAEIPATVALGMRGSGPLLEFAILGRYGPLLRPRHTVFAFFAGNDWENLAYEQTLPWLAEALAPGAAFGPPVPAGTLAAARPVIAAEWDADVPDAWALLSRTDFVRNFLALHQTTLALGLHYPKSAEPQPVYAEILRRSKALAATWGGDITVVYIADVGRYHGLLPTGFAYDVLRRHVAAATTAAGVDLVDLEEVFSAQPQPLALYADDAHLSAAGAALAARTVAARLGDAVPVVAARLDDPL